MDLLPRDFCEVLAANSERVKIMETCGGDPTLMAATTHAISTTACFPGASLKGCSRSQELNRVLRAGGVEIIITKCVQVKHALTAQNKLGSDMVTLMGYDSGGLPGEADVSSARYPHRSVVAEEIFEGLLVLSGRALDPDGARQEGAQDSVPRLRRRRDRRAALRGAGKRRRWRADGHSLQRDEGVQHLPGQLQAGGT